MLKKYIPKHIDTKPGKHDDEPTRYRMSSPDCDQKRTGPCDLKLTERKSK